MLGRDVRARSTEPTWPRHERKRRFHAVVTALLSLPETEGAVVDGKWVSVGKPVYETARVAAGAPQPASLVWWRDTPVGRVARGHGPPQGTAANLYTVTWTDDSYMIIDWGRPRASKVSGFDVGTRRQHAGLRAGLHGQLDGVEMRIVQPRGGLGRERRRVVISAADQREWFWQKGRGFEFWRAADTSPVYRERRRTTLREDITEDEMVLAEATRDLGYFTSPWWWLQF